MKNTATNRIQELALPKESHARLIVLAGLAVLGILVASYVYFVGKIVFDVVGRRTAEASSQRSASRLSSLQTEYFGQLRSLDLASAASAGLEESRHTLYAARTHATVGLASRP